MSTLVHLALHNVWMGLKRGFANHPSDSRNQSMVVRFREIDAKATIKGAESTHFSLHPIAFPNESLGEYRPMWSQANGEYSLSGLFSEKQKRFISLSPMNYESWQSIEDFEELYEVCNEATSATEALKELKVDLNKYLEEVVESLKSEPRSKEGDAIKRKLQSFIREWQKYERSVTKSKG